MSGYFTIEKIGGRSADGSTVIYTKESDEMIECKIPRYEEGTRVYTDAEGNYRADLSGLSEETVRRIGQAERFYYATRDFLPYQDYLYVVSKFPTNCFDQYEKNPFFLTDITREGCDLPLCQFPQIDRAIKLPTFDARLKEMQYVIRHVLEVNEAKGHTWMTYGELSKRVKSLLSITKHPLLTGSVSAYLEYYKSLFYVERETPYEESKVGLYSTYLREHIIHHVISRATSTPTPFPCYNPVIPEGLAKEQEKAVKNLILRGGHVSILTGGPGTGKTTILQHIIENMEACYPNINTYLLSPTGKAARRIKEVFGARDVEVSTVHKFLGVGHQISGKEKARLATADLVIVDESSMLDLDIFEKLVSGINMDRAKLILVGDADQLPSIGTGNILSDLIDLGVYTVRLKQNFRSQGSIIDNALKINSGELFLKEDESFQILDISKYGCDRLAAYDPDSDIVITPYRVEKKLGSSIAVNRLTQSRVMNRPYNEMVRLYPGDRIIMNRTDYKAGYFNGESGVIAVCLPEHEYEVDFGDRVIHVSREEDIDLGYAITVHKSQGSEYESADLCIPEYSPFITRRMLYTAITRGKNKVKIWIGGGRETLRKIILNNPEIQRNTFLSSFGNFEQIY